jgi:hypothetical protein
MRAAGRDPLEALMQIGLMSVGVGVAAGLLTALLPL